MCACSCQHSLRVGSQFALLVLSSLSTKAETQSMSSFLWNTQPLYQGVHWPVSVFLVSHAVKRMHCSLSWQELHPEVEGFERWLFFFLLYPVCPHLVFLFIFCNSCSFPLDIFMFHAGTSLTFRFQYEKQDSAGYTNNGATALICIYLYSGLTGDLPETWISERSTSLARWDKGTLLFINSCCGDVSVLFVFR